MNQTVWQKPALWVVIGAFALFALGSCGSYNGLVSAQTNYEKSWSNVEAQYQRRFDVIPNFVQTAKFSAKFQQDLAIEYAKARQGVSDAAATKDPVRLQAAADDGFKGLQIRVQQEAVPQAKTEQLTELNAQVESIERAISHERGAYNTSCQTYRNKTRHFPSGMLASIFGFDKDGCQFFKSAPGTEKAPGVNFN